MRIIIQFNINIKLSIFHCYEYRSKQDARIKIKIITCFDLDENLKSYDWISILKILSQLVLKYVFS